MSLSLTKLIMIEYDVDIVVVRRFMGVGLCLNMSV